MAGQLLLSRPGWLDTVIVQASGVQASWNVDAPGLLSAELSVDVLNATGVTDPKGRWLRYEHPSAGRWAGIVTDRRKNGDGSISVSATSMHWLLSAKRTARSYRTGQASAGALAQRALRDAATETCVWIDSIAADEDGAWYSHEWRGDDLLNVLDRFASDADQEYDITVADGGTIAFEWRVRLGSDKTGRVLLREGAELSGVDVTESIATVINDMLGVSDVRQWATSVSTVAENADSIVAYGRRQGSRSYLGADRQSLEAYARSDVDRLADPVQAMRGTISATHPVANEIRHGDIVRVWLAGYEGTFRVTNRAVDEEAGTIVLSGELGVDVA